MLAEFCKMIAILLAITKERILLDTYIWIIMVDFPHHQKKTRTHTKIILHFTQSRFNKHKWCCK